jgi:signal transduction histidine kinase/CheY-like chemotaxis protein
VVVPCTFALAATGTGTVSLHPALLAAPLVTVLAQRCAGWPLALGALVALLSALGLWGLATPSTIATTGLASALLVAASEWLSRAGAAPSPAPAATPDTVGLRTDTEAAQALLALERVRSEALERALADARAAVAANEGAVRSREELLSLVSHDLRSALNAMVGWLYLARSPTTEPGPRQRAIDGIASAVDTQRRLVDQLLDATRVLSGRSPAASRPVLPEALFQRVVARLGPRATERSIELHIAPAAPGLAFLADPSRAEDSLCALVDHAMAITPAHGVVRLQVRAAAGTMPTRVLIEVDGDGLAQAKDSQVRGPVAAPTLAMAVARAVTELQGGTLDIHAASPAAGMHLSLSFPAAAAPAAEASDAMRTPQAAKGPAPGSFEEAPPGDAPELSERLNGCYILLTDDREDMLEVGATVLRGHGAHVTTACSAAESIDLYPAWACGGGERLLISDLSMPGIDGIEMIGRIRRIEAESALPRVPAVAFSAQSDQYPRRTVMQAGFDMFLAKPLSPAQLIRAISQLIGR